MSIMTCTSPFVKCFHNYLILQCFATEHTRLLLDFLIFVTKEGQAHVYTFSYSLTTSDKNLYLHVKKKKNPWAIVPVPLLGIRCHTSHSNCQTVTTVSSLFRPRAHTALLLSGFRPKVSWTFQCSNNQNVVCFDKPLVSNNYIVQQNI